MELIIWSPKRNAMFNLLSNTLNYFLKKCMEMSMENWYVDVGVSSGLRR